MALAESARWSNWPGRYSTAKAMSSSLGGRAAVASSTWGSENTVCTARRKGFLVQAPPRHSG